MSQIDEYPILFFSTRSDPWNYFRAGAICDEFGHVETFTDKEKLAVKIAKHPGRVFAHCDGGADMLFLGRGLQNVCMTDSKIMRAQYGRASLHDLARLMGNDFGEIARTLGHERMGGDSADDTEDAALARATQDAMIGAKAVRAFKDWIGKAGDWSKLPTTSGLTAIHLMEKLEPENVATMRKLVLDPAAIEEQTQATNGGRVELFQMGHVPKAWVYDRNSSYIASYFEGVLPVGPWKRVGGERKGKLGIYFCTVKQDPKRLPLVPAGHTWAREGKGWLTSEEIEAVRQVNGTVEVGIGWVSEKTLTLGTKFAEFLYPFKREGLPWAKGALVALHGKFSQGCEQEIYVDTGRGYVRDLSLGLPSWYQQPLLCAFVYGRARLALGRLAQAVIDRGFRIFQFADDAMHTDCPPERLPEGTIGTEIGRWKIAHAEAEACYIATKVYGLRFADGSTHIVSRGINPRIVTWDHLLQCAAGHSVELTDSDRMVGFRGAMLEGRDATETESPTFTLRRHRGGKKENPDGSLDYKA